MRSLDFRTELFSLLRAPHSLISSQLVLFLLHPLMNCLVGEQVCETSLAPVMKNEFEANKTVVPTTAETFALTAKKQVVNQLRARVEEGVKEKTVLSTASLEGGGEGTLERSSAIEIKTEVRSCAVLAQDEEACCPVPSRFLHVS